MDSKLILITCLIKLGVSAAVASAVMRSRVFKDLLFRPHRELRHELSMLAFIAVPIMLGVWVRLVVPNFYAADVAFEMSILMGLIAGRSAGVIAGAVVGIPALWHGHEWLAPLMNILCGFVGGVCRDAAHSPEDIWSFSPFMDLSIYRWLKRVLRNPFRMDWQITFFSVIVVLQFLRMEIARQFPGRLFDLDSPGFWIQVAIYATVAACVAIPLKVWNVNRIELKLQEQERLLLQARLDALQSQVNPHFLFNTLNSVSSLVRFQPETAREVVLKLSKILRTLLSRHDAFVPLRDEIAFIDDYVDIEVIRFGRDKLRFDKNVTEECLDVIIPSMILQPLVENSIKHGIAPRIEGGVIQLRAHLLPNDRLHLALEDNGVGMEASRKSHPSNSTKIGMSNIADRLHVLYGDDAAMHVLEGDGGGTLIVLEVPALYSSGNLTDSAATMVYSIRSSTRS